MFYVVQRSIGLHRDVARCTDVAAHADGITLGVTIRDRQMQRVTL